MRLHEHQVPNPDSNLDHNPHGRGGLSLDLNPVCLRVNATDQDLDQNPRGLFAVDLRMHFSLSINIEKIGLITFIMARLHENGHHSYGTCLV